MGKVEVIVAVVAAAATILSALISAAVTLVVCIKNNNAQQKRIMENNNEQQAQFMAELDKQNTMTRYRLEQLEAKVSAHNHFDSRLVSLEERVKTIFNKLAG